MIIPKAFRDALDRAYCNRGELNKLFVEHREFIERLAKWSLRSNHWAIISDSEDMFQEACIWILDSMWKWDETRGTPLAEYVVYNVGTRLRNAVARETVRKRIPDKQMMSLNARPSKNIESNSDDSMYDYISSNEATQEEIYSIKEIYERMEKELPYAARHFMNCLVEEEGDFGRATKRMKKGIKGIAPSSDNAFRISVKRHIMPKIRSALLANNILASSNSKSL